MRQHIIGHDWKFGDTDGGPGSIGTVLDVRRDGKVVVSIAFKIMNSLLVLSQNALKVIKRYKT